MKTLKGLMVVGMMAAATAAFAQSTADSPANADNVTATVLEVCTISTFDIDFGNYDPTAAAALTATDDVSVTCSNGTAYTVSLDNGLYFSGGRRMDGPGADFLNYTLTLATNSGTGDGTAQTHTVDGEIATGQFVTAGSYVDTVVATVTY